MSLHNYGIAPKKVRHWVAAPKALRDAVGAFESYAPSSRREGEERHHFTLTGIPEGDYHLYQHLIGEPKTYTFGGHTTTYTEPTASWGGIPVHIEASSATVLKDFSEYPLSDLQVRVTDANGHPVGHATLRIRDRMSESWRQVEENPAQVEQAAHPIPIPAAARIVAGRATLSHIREGWLDLSVESDDGATFSYTVPVSPKSELSLKLPPEKR